jgi:hypothetical protein
MFDATFPTDTVKDVRVGMNRPLMIGELDAIIRQEDVDPVGHGGNPVKQDVCGRYLPSLWVQFYESQRCAAVDGKDELPLAIRRVNLSNINVKGADRVGAVRRLRRRVAYDLGQSADVVPLQTAVHV